MKTKMVALLVLLAAVAGAVILFRFDPARTPFYPPCPFRRLTGCLCPGCGSLRATHQLLHGNLAEAIKLNAFSVLLLVPTLAGIAFEIRRVMGGKGLQLTKVPAALIHTLIVAIVCFWLARNFN